ncbi:hypothetical protein [Vallitalea guaymasensis]|uniref:Uncharacterized protein n=1 Tax=Vallitalea guaymasensis TaxID=1185412 RepID=A0A8J8M9V2_9FIRM|nr:hypothetical protein [Vallitalea guaymasensis]QUH28785.1 hypothetical protein HYG85_07615 [Vallitalea guaymasensis]
MVRYTRENIEIQLELNRLNPNDKPYFETFTLYDFKRGLSKITQIKLVVALDLATKDIEYHNEQS